MTEKHEGGQVWKFEWSVEGQLTKIIQPSGQQWRYEYDPFGRRIRKEGGGTSIAYVWDGSVVCEEIRERAGEDATTVAWVFEPESFRPLLKREHGKTYFCITDHAGTPRELVTKSGEVAWSARFNVWGKLQAPNKSSIDCPVRFQGQWFDEESGLHYNRYRYFEPESRQYLSPDPIGLNGGARSYGYVDNPLSLVDPLGLAACDNQKFASREDAHNAAKDRAGIPRSQEPSDQWDVGSDQIRRGTGDPNYRYSDDPGAAGHYEQYDTPQGSRIIAEHTADPKAPDPHFHAGQPKGDPSDPDYDFRNNRYQQVDGKHHYFYTP